MKKRMTNMELLTLARKDLLISYQSLVAAHRLIQSGDANAFSMAEGDVRSICGLRDPEFPKPSQCWCAPLGRTEKMTNLIRFTIRSDRTGAIYTLSIKPENLAREIKAWDYREFTLLGVDGVDGFKSPEPESLAHDLNKP